MMLMCIHQKLRKIIPFAFSILVILNHLTLMIRNYECSLIALSLFQFCSLVFVTCIHLYFVSGFFADN